MAYSRILLGNAIFMAVVLISNVTGIADMVGSYAERATYSLADVAHMRRFQSDFCPISPEWYEEGMQIFQFTKGDKYWEKKRLTWSLAMEPTVSMTRTRAHSAIGAAFGKWAKVTKLDFNDVTPSHEADITIWFVKNQELKNNRAVEIPNQRRMDFEGVSMRFMDTDTDMWTIKENKNYSNFPFVILREVGHALGLEDSNDETAIMYKNNIRGIDSNDDPTLTKDDIDGIQAKYGKR